MGEYADMPYDWYWIYGDEYDVENDEYLSEDEYNQMNGYSKIKY